MRSFLRYIFVLTIFMAASWVILPQLYAMEFPRNPGPEFAPHVRNFYIRKLSAERPEIALLGDSTLTEGVDPDMLSALMDRKVSRFDIPGSASAYWYLIVKNNIALAEHSPRVLVIFFRDTILTAPGYRVHGVYFDRLDEFAGNHEPVLLERSYINLMNPLEAWSEQHMALYAARGRIRQEIDGRLRYSLPAWMGCQQDCTDMNISQVLVSGDLEPGQLQKALAAADRYLYTPNQLNFERQVDQSFLPEIIHITKERGIQLILVRMKNEMGGEANVESVLINNYMNSLSDYLNAQDVPLLDYGTDSRLSTEHYRDLVHLNEDGKIIFTQMLAEGLNSLLK